MADLFKKKNNAEATEAPAPKEAKAKKEKKTKAPKDQYLKPNRMNFLERYETLVEGKKAELDLDKYKKPYFIVLAVLLVILVVFIVLLSVTKVQVKSYEKYINDPNNASTYSKALKLKGDTERIKLEKANIEKMINAISTYPNINKEFFAALSNAATNNNVTINNYGYAGQSGFISIPCVASSPQDISNFVTAIEATGLFDSVEYTGFDGGAEGGYAFNVSCYCVVGK